MTLRVPEAGGDGRLDGRTAALNERCAALKTAEAWAAGQAALASAFYDSAAPEAVSAAIEKLLGSS